MGRKNGQSQKKCSLPKLHCSIRRMYYVVTVVVFPEAEDGFFSKKKRKYRITFRLLIWTAVRLREDTKVETKGNVFFNGGRFFAGRRER